MKPFLLSLCAATAIIASPMFAAAETKTASVVAFPSTARPFADNLVLRGRTEANRSVEVRSEIQGLVISEPLRKGATVEKGEVLCQIDDGDRIAEKTEAEARLAEALQNADAADQLVKKGFTSTTRANTMVAELEQARARLTRAEIAIERLTIEAPFDGILDSDTAELGSLLQNGSVCATLMSLDPIKMVAFAPERTVDQLKVGAPVRGRLITGREIEGEISFVSRSADRDTRTYLVEATTPNPDLDIRDGMTTEISVGLQGGMAHLLPQTALTLDNDGALGVRVVDDGTARFVPVEVLRDETLGVWVSGLPDTAEIIVVGQEFVIDGQKLDVEYVDPERTQ